MTQYRYENLLVRTEAARYPLPEEDQEELDWTLEIDRANDSNVVLSGHLYRVGQDGYGQALVMAVIHASNDEEVLEDLDYFSTWAQDVGCIEAMYDTCRRSINAQGSLMDCDFGLPVKAPESRVTVREAEQHDPDDSNARSTIAE